MYLLENFSPEKVDDRIEAAVNRKPGLWSEWHSQVSLKVQSWDLQLHPGLQEELHCKGQNPRKRTTSKGHPYCIVLLLVLTVLQGPNDHGVAEQHDSQGDHQPQDVDLQGELSTFHLVS